VKLRSFELYIAFLTFVGEETDVDNGSNQSMPVPVPMPFVSTMSEIVVGACGGTAGGVAQSYVPRSPHVPSLFANNPPYYYPSKQA